MPDGDHDNLTLTTLPSMAGVDKSAWDRLTQPEGQPYYPFSTWDFLDALEISGSVRPDTGWGPHHVMLKRDEQLTGVMPLYLKGHSRGEFVFDHGWADAYERAGGRYYPKLLGAIPFTPATGPRFHGETEEDRAALMAGARQLTEELGVSSLHVTFPREAEAKQAEHTGYLLRTGTQYRFEDDGFVDWDGFLAALASRKRKSLRKEREAISAEGVEIEWVTGRDITEVHLDHFWRFYQDTGSRKWGSPYLTRTFFSLITERMANHIVFIFAKREGRYIAGAMNFIGGDTLFGRYWGCTEHIPFLHFECCYYQAIDFALEHGLSYVDAGAQGEHKIARGYRPVTTYSLHYLPNASFRDAVARFLAAEREEVDDAIRYLDNYTPFRKDGA